METGLKSLLCVSIFAVALPAQGELVLDACGGGIGKSLKFTITNGQKLKSFLFITSLQRALIPLSIVDPKDKRFLRVGLDLVAINLFGLLDSNGKASFSLPIPNITALSGLNLLHQALSFPGPGMIFDRISDVVVVPIAPAGSFMVQARVLLLARSFHSSLPLGDGIHLVVGGGNGGLLGIVGTKTTEFYDLAKRSFSFGPNMSIERAVHTQTELTDGRYALVGGVDFNNDPHKSIEFFDPATRKFSTGPNMADKRMLHMTTRLKDGRLFVTGGLSDLNGGLAALGSALNTTEIYNPKTNTWTKGPNMSLPRAAHASLLLPNGKVLIVGGITWTFFIIKIPGVTAACDLYDPATNKITPVASMTDVRALFISTLLPNGRVLVGGGATGTILSVSAFNKVEIYDPVTKRWTQASPMLSSRGLATTLDLGAGRLGVFGGGTLKIVNNQLLPTPIAQAEAYDPKTGKWTALPSLKSPRASATLIGLQSCGILAVGGGSGPASIALRTTELWVR